MPATVAGPGGAVLDGVLERVTFANPETGYTIARIAPERGAELVTAVGPLLGAQIGEFLRLRGRWSSHPRYGRQFEVHSYATVLPATAAGIQKYLGSGLIKGIGPVMAERMVAHFGVDIMHIIEDEPGRLTEVGGLGPKRTAMIAAAWAEQEAIKEVMIFLQSIGGRRLDSPNSANIALGRTSSMLFRLAEPGARTRRSSESKRLLPD
jgi:exodeoxyribonuclease V alpha subunit